MTGAGTSVTWDREEHKCTA